MARGVVPEWAMTACASCRRPRGNVTRQGWQRIIGADGQLVGWTCSSCPRWDEPIRRVEQGGTVRFKAMLDATPTGTYPRRQAARRCKSLAEARKFVDEVRAVTESGKVYGATAPIGVEADRRQTVNELCERWLTSRVDVRANTVQGYARWLSPIRRNLGDRLAADLTIADIRAVVSWLSREGGRRGQPLSATSVKGALKALRMVLDMAVDEGTIGANVARARSIKMPRDSQHEQSDTSKPLEYWPTVGDGEQASVPIMKRFRDHADTDRLAGAWRLSLSGITRSEVLGLQWADINFEAGEVTISRGRTPLDNGGSAVDNPKSAARYRVVPVEQMHSGSMRLLRALRALQSQDRLAAGAAWQPSAFVVTDALGKPLAPRTYSDRWTRLCRAAGVPVIGLHQVRHTLAQMLITRRVPIDVAAGLLGHSVAVFEQSYLPRANADRIREYAKAVIRAA